MSRRSLLSVLLAISVLGVACSKEEPQQQPPATLGQPSDPMVEVKAQLAKDPNNTDALYHLGDLYDRSEMFPEAANAFEKLLRIDPKYGYAHVRLGTVYDRLGRFEDAVVQYKEAAKIFPKNPVIFNNLAFAYGKTGKVEQQIAAYKQAIRIRPRYATAHFNLGMVYLHKKKDLKRAREQYAELAKFDEPTADSLKQEIDKAGGRR
jgi:tetratricopeptide (TPR) repeat protein